MKIFPPTAVTLTVGGGALGVAAVLEIGDGATAVDLPAVGSANGTAVVA
jgi:hypothetical protein